MNLVTTEQLKQQIWEKEGVKIEIRKPEGSLDRLVRSYDFERLPDDATVSDLQERIDYCLSPFIYDIKL